MRPNTGGGPGPPLRLAVLSHTVVRWDDGAYFIKNRVGEMLTSLADLDWTVTVVARRHHAVEEFTTYRLPSSIRVALVDPGAGRRRKMRQLLDGLRAVRDADAVLVLMPSLFSAALALATGRPIVMYAGSAWSLRDDFPRWRGWLEALVASRSGAVIASGDAIAERFAHVRGVNAMVAVPQVPPEVVERLRNPVAGEEGADAVRLLFVGSVARLKGMAELIAALRRLPHLECRVVGPTADARFLSELAELPNVTVDGYADWEQLKEHYQWATVLVLPSYTEGLPRVIHEATAFGDALVLTPVGGIPARLTDAEDALFVGVGDADALERALRTLAEHPERISVLAGAARRALAPLFSAPSSAHQFDDVLRSLVASRTR